MVEKYPVITLFDSTRSEIYIILNVVRRYDI